MNATHQSAEAVIRLQVNKEKEVRQQQQNNRLDLLRFILLQPCPRRQDCSQLGRAPSHHLSFSQTPVREGGLGPVWATIECMQPIILALKSCGPRRGLQHHEIQKYQQRSNKARVTVPHNLKGISPRHYDS